MSIEVRDIRKNFGSFAALDGVSLDFPSGELVALLGPSGCGKTSLLRIIAGLEVADSGTVLLDGEDASHTHVRERQVGFVFQHYALFKHMSVFDNVAFGLRMKPKRERPNEAAIAKKVHDLLALVQLDWLHDRFPAQLSGGQRQRIALVRALAVEPRVLLLDEPFGALDAKVRKELRRWLRRLHDELHITSIFVTHDQEEALEVADRVVLMNQGQVEQVGSPSQVYEQPATPFVYGFLGHVNAFHGQWAGGALHFAGGHLLAGDVAGIAEGAGVTGFARPHELQLLRPDACADGVLARVTRIQTLGFHARVELDTLGDGLASAAEKGLPPYLDVDVPRSQLDALALVLGSTLRVVPQKLRVFARQEPSFAQGQGQGQARIAA
jgi:sulfate transport system ATP-binding protein